MAQALELQPFDDRTQRFLDSIKKESTRDIYRSGLTVFQSFYKDRGTVDDFINRIATDLSLPLGKRQHVATTTLSAFIDYMKLQLKQSKKVLDNTSVKGQPLSAMTINTYVGAIRSLVSDAFENEYRIPCKKIGLPSPEPVSSKTPWELETISQFFKPMKPMYQALGGSLFQSGQGLNEILCLNYSDILVEFESNTRPLMLTMQRKKTGIKYVTFLGDSALDLLSNYFKTEGKPKPNERIFPIEKETVERYFSRRCIKMLQPKKIKRKEQVSVDTSLKPWGKGNCPMRPHSLRAGFEKLLVKGKCPQVYAEYWMGHSVSRLHDAYIISGMSTEEWRKEYKKYEPFLSFEV